MSFRVGLTGLGAATADLGVTADNIANSNTTGFKASRAEFADIVAASGSAVGNTVIGDGVQLAAVTQQFQQGNIGFTGNPLDLAVSGEGFFRVSDNGSVLFSRAGAFGTDRDGFIVNSLGQRLTGFIADANGTITGNLTDLSIDTSDLAPNTTTRVDLGANLNAAASVPPTAVFNVNDPSSFNDSTSLTFFDSLGAAHSLSVFFRKTAPNAWENFFAVDGAQVGAATPVTFNTSGVLTAPATGTITTASFTPAGAAAMAIDVDVSELTQFGSQFGVNFLSQDGFSSGQLAAVAVEETGVIFARYTNGESLALGQVALADFTNVQGLTRVGENNFAESFGSGQPLVGAPGSSTLGVIQSGALEDSNVELTEELVNVIQAQRNFQANAQVITASDTLTQTILNIS